MRPGRRQVAAAVAAGSAFVATVVAAVVRAFVSDWYPVGDNAYFALRSQDVLTEHHPLLGTWTSASHSVGFDFNNPGPLYFDLLALPAKIDPRAVPVGVALLVLGSVAALAVCAARVAGARGVLVSLFAATALAWAMGPELLVDPWQPHALLFPFLALIGITAVVVAGSDGSLVAWIALASLIVQTHLSYGPLVGTLGVAAVGAVGWRAIRRRSTQAAPALVASVVVLILCWAQPLIEQLTADGRGNLARIATAAGEDRGDSVGPALAFRITGTVLMPLPRWLPPSFTELFRDVPDLRSEVATLDRVLPLWLGVVALVATLAGLAVVAMIARRRGAPALVSAAAVTGVAVVAAVITATALPLSETSGLPPHHIRWLWPVAVACTAVPVAGLLGTRRGPMLVGAATVAMALSAMWPTHPDVGPTADADAGPALRAVAPQLDVLEGRGPFRLDLDGLRVFEPYSIAVVLELERRGVDVVVEEPGMVRQLGPARRASGTEPRLFVWEGELGVRGRPGLERVALATGLTGAEQQELEERTEAVSAWFAEGDLTLTERGRRAVRAERIPDFDAMVAAGTDPLTAVGPGYLRVAVASDLVVSRQHEQGLERWAELRSRFDRQTVGVWVDPPAT